MSKIWTEHYRPSNMEECILPERIKVMFDAFLKEKNFPNLILTGPPGIGKTSLAVSLAKNLDWDYLKINASLEKGIDVVKDKIANFASTVSFKGGKKIIILDEADGLMTAPQDALRAFIEEYSSNAAFIFICNNLSRIIDAIQSRCEIVDFTLSKDEMKKFAIGSMNIISTMLGAEGISFNKAAVAGVIKKHFPDLRKIITTLQTYAIQNNEIDSGILAVQKDESIGALAELLKGKRWSEMRKWVTENNYHFNDFAAFAKELRKVIEPMLEASSWPSLVVLSNEYDYKNYFVLDKEINVASFLTQLMNEVVWK